MYLTVYTIINGCDTEKISRSPQRKCFRARNMIQKALCVESRAQQPVCTGEPAGSPRATLLSMSLQALAPFAGGISKALERSAVPAALPGSGSHFR